MKRIHQIDIKNFKAFRELTSFPIRGKNVLVYGNNGSGKSSVFWALYTFLQSSIKVQADVEKYFKFFLDSNKNTHQTLRNVFMEEAEDSFIKITTVNTDDNHREIFEISNSNINTIGNQTIQELNLASDFINYKLLHNFYRASHKNEVNLWQVFERDIFPFLVDGANEGFLEKIKRITNDVPRTPRGYKVTNNSNRKNAYINQLNNLNTEISGLLSQIETNANEFIKQHFFDGKDVIRVGLSFQKKFKFDNVKYRMWLPKNAYFRYEELKIKLLVEVFDDASNSWKQVHRVQSFLNEAQLTRIAMGIRIGALRTRVQTTDFKILVLDDMLISLDMSNRMRVIKMILNIDNKPELKFFDDFQKIVLTHDKGFYELIKRYTSSNKWQYFNFYKSESSNNSSPNVKQDRERIQKAIQFLRDGEFDACGNELRKETEAVLDKYLRGLNEARTTGNFTPLTDKLNEALNKLVEQERKDFKKVFVKKSIPIEILKKITTDVDGDTTLTPAQKGQLKGLKNDLLNYLIRQYEMKESKGKIIEETKDILIRIMNPASHASFVPLYEEELRKAINGVKQLSDFFEEQLNPTTNAIPTVNQ